MYKFDLSSESKKQPEASPETDTPARGEGVYNLQQKSNLKLVSQDLQRYPTHNIKKQRQRDDSCKRAPCAVPCICKRFQTQKSEFVMLKNEENKS